MSAHVKTDDTPAPTGAGRRFSIRVAHGRRYVPDAALPDRAADTWQASGAFDIPSDVGERLQELSVDVDADGFVHYRAVLVSLRGDEA